MQIVPGGWRPILSDDATMIALGNGFVRLLDVASGRLRDVGGVDGPATVGSMYACGWHQGKVCISVQDVGNRRTLIGGPIAVPQEQCPGYRPTVAVKNGHVCSSLNGEHFIDGQKMAYADSQSPCWDIDDFDGQYYLYKETDADPWPMVCRRVDGSLVRRDAGGWYQNARVFTAPDGQPWIFANLNGRAIVVSPQGIFTSPAGESRGVLTWHNGELLAWTVLIDRDGSPVLLGRAWSAGMEGPAMQLRGLWFAGLDVVPTPAGYLFAGYFDGPGGAAYVETIPYTAPRAPFAFAEETLDPVPAVLEPMLDGYLTSDPAAPGILGGTHSGKAHLIEGCHQDGTPWWTREEEARLRVIFMDPQESHAADVEERNALAAQDRTGAWLGWYCDRPRFTDDVLKKARASVQAGRPSLLILRAYPSGPNDTAEAIADRLQADITLYRGEFKLMVCAPTYDQSGFWSTVDPLLVRKTLRAICRVLQDNQGAVLGLVFFGWKRPPVVTAIEDDARAICGATADVDVDLMLPRRLPTPPVTQPPVVPPAPVIPPVTKPVQKPKPSQTPKVAVAIGGGILAALLAFFKRKKS